MVKSHFQATMDALCSVHAFSGKKTAVATEKDCIIPRTTTRDLDRNKTKRRDFMTDTGFLNAVLFALVINEFLDVE